MSIDRVKEYEYQYLIKEDKKRKLKKMPKLQEDRYKGRKLNHRTKKNKAKE